MYCTTVSGLDAKLVSCNPRKWTVLSPQGWNSQTQAKERKPQTKQSHLLQIYCTMTLMAENLHIQAKEWRTPRTKQHSGTAQTYIKRRVNWWIVRQSKRVLKARLCLHLKQNGTSFEDGNVMIPDRADRWFDGGVNETICDKPDL